MIPKKAKKADLENKRVIFFQIGLLISLAVALLAFEWSTAEPKEIVIPDKGDDFIVEDLLINTFSKKEIPPEIKPCDLFTLNIKGNDDLIDKSIDFTVEIDPWEEVDIPYEPEKPVDDVTFIDVSERPAFMNGDLSNFIRYIQSSVIYQQEAISMKIQGKVIASFVVNKEGYVENIRIVKGIDPLLDNEVIKALKASPRWKPGRQRDVPVKVAYTIPVIFKITY